MLLLITMVKWLSIDYYYDQWSISVRDMVQLRTGDDNLYYRCLIYPVKRAA